MTSLCRSLFAFFFIEVITGMAGRVSAQISVGPSGLPPQIFDSAPGVSQWSTLSVGPVVAGGVITSGAQLDGAVQTNAATRVNVALPTSSTVPPAVSPNAQWNSTGRYLQTRANQNWYTLLMTTLRNDTGSNIAFVSISYDLAARVAAGANIVEEVPGHRVYYSLTGATGTWVHIPEFDSASSIDAGPRDALVALEDWAPNAVLHLLWADANGSAAFAGANQEGGYTIDNFAVSAIPPQAGPPIITVQPQSQAVNFPNTVRFSVTALGTAPLFYQWFKDSGIVGGATNTRYTLNNATTVDQNFYFVVVSNSLGTATSSLAMLTVNCDETATPPTVTAQPSAQSMNSGGTISLNVGASGTPPIAYQWYRNGAAIPTATGSAYTKANAQPADSGLYSVVVANCAGSVTSSTAMVSILIPPYFVLGLTDHFWRYEESNTDLGQAWRAVSYDDSGWQTGRGIFAREDNPTISPLTNTVLTLKDSGGVNNIITHYFRTSFVLTNNPEWVILVASNYFDDGAVVYVNGAEAFRYNMPGGDIQFSTRAPAVNPAGEGTFVVSNILSDLLVQGTNLVAVELHEATLTSADTAFGMALIVRNIPPEPPTIATQPSSTTVFAGDNASMSVGLSGGNARYQWFQNGDALPGANSSTLLLTNVSFHQNGAYFVVASNSLGSVTSSVVVLNVLDRQLKLRLLEFTNAWRFDQSGADLGVAWRAPGYNDASWPSSPGVLANMFESGYPEPFHAILSLLDESSRPITTYYFRTHFTVPAGLTNLVLLASNLLDDGAIFYINDVEAARVRLIGSVTAGTFAAASPTDGHDYEIVFLSSASMVAGDNVLAVEVHQSSSFSSDVIFGMSLDAYGAFDQAVVILNPLASQTVLEGTPATFYADVFGGQPFFIQWFHNSVAMAGETNVLLNLPAVHGADAGGYYFIASNSLNAVTSSVATLSIILDVTPPALVEAFATNDPEGIVVVFSEPVSAQSATNPANYTLSPGANILAARLIAPNRVLLTASALDVRLDYTLTISNVLDLADSPNAIAPGSSTPVRPNRFRAATGLLQVQTVFIILMENHSWGAIKDNPDCPYINSLLPFASYCENYSSPGNMRLSEPNYIWLEAGTNFGFTQGFGPLVDRITTSNHLSSQLFRAGIEWRGYMEDMPYGSTGVSNINDYLSHHNPFAFFDDVTTNYAYCTNHVRPYAEFAGDLAAGRIGSYNFISPNRTNDMQSQLSPVTSAEKQGDDWLARELPPILASPAFTNGGAVFITFDETDFDTNRNIGMILLSPLAKGNGYASYVPYDHSSTLRTMQEIFGVRPYLGAAATASPLNDLFKDLSLFVTQSNGAPVVRLENIVPGTTNYVQASSDLVNWTTISTNVATNAISIVDPGATGASQRFYRAIELP